MGQFSLVLNLVILPMTPFMACVMLRCLLASRKSSSFSSMRNSVVSAHKWAPAEWPINTMLSYKTQKTGKQEEWMNEQVFSNKTDCQSYN